MRVGDGIILRDRFVIKTVLDTLKYKMGLEHLPPRPRVNALGHFLAHLVTWAFRPGKSLISFTGGYIQAYP